MPTQDLSVVLIVIVAAQTGPTGAHRPSGGNATHWNLGFFSYFLSIVYFCPELASTYRGEDKNTK